MDVDRYRLAPKTDVRLKDWSTNDTDGFDGNKDDAQSVLIELNRKLFDLQQLLFAEANSKVLVVLQGMDTSGKDGTIKHVFQMVNPLGVQGRQLQATERRRARARLPLAGAPQHAGQRRHHDLQPQPLRGRARGAGPRPRTRRRCGRRRYEHIRNFEQMLADEGTVIRKFFLHISKDKQRERLQERLDIPTKHWKFEHGDLDERKYWDAYTDGLRGGAVRARRPRTRPGTSSRRTASGTATCWSVDDPRRDPRVARPELSRAGRRPRQDQHRRLIVLPIRS